MKFIKLLLILLTSSVFAQNKGTILGTLTDKDAKNSALTAANVLLKNTKFSTNTDMNGKYKLNVPAGDYIIQFSFVGYETIEIPVKVVAGETITIDKTLGTASNSLKDVVIKSAPVSREKETVLLLDQKKAVEIKQSIGAQEMSRKGISDVEEGLTKITGITKVDGRGLFVRGLEDRYNSLLINGLAVPSNNPFKKIIPLDLFPTDIVGVLDTYKTFNSNLYGDFAGATFDIITAKGGKSMTKVNFGSGYTTGNNLEKFILSKGVSDASNYFGFPADNRNIPTALGSVPSNKVLSANEASTQFASGYDVEQTVAPLNTNFGILNAQKYYVGKNTLNYLFSLNYDNKFELRKGIDRFFGNGGFYENNLINTKYTFTTSTSALLALNFKSEKLNLTVNTFYLKTTENMIQDQLGYTGANTINGKNSFFRLNQLKKTSFFNAQILADYKLSSNDRSHAKVGISYTKTSFEMPDRKTFQGTKVDENTTNISYSGNSLYRQYFNMDGKYHFSGLAEYSYKFGNEDFAKSNKFTVGYNGYNTKMQSNIRFLVSDGSSNSATITTNTPDAYFATQTKAGNFTYREGTNATYYADLEESNNSGYLDLALKFGEKYQLNLGGRLEQFDRKIKYRKPGLFADPFKIENTNTLDFLPSLNMKFSFYDKSNVRFAVSKTKTKPVIMEVYPVEIVNLDGTIENGNPELINSDNYNFDLKYELFPSNKELLAVTAFSKYINNPIERIFTASAGSTQIISYDNSKSAVIFGAELEALYQLERISKSLSSFSLGFNTSLMYSKVTIDKVKNKSETIVGDENPVRQLQGASPWLINADLRYDFKFNENWKNTVTLVYNVFGDRIFAVGTVQLDNIYEKSVDKLDLVLGSKINTNWDLKFSIDNILNPLYKMELGNNSRRNINETDLTVKSYKKGVGCSFNLAYSF
jgi:outer membrane receptor protein involved in Fe transport